MKYIIKRKNQIIAQIRPEGQLQTSIMGEELVTMAFSLGRYIRFQTGDSVQVYGNLFYLASEPQVEKISTREFRYSLEFQGIKYELSKVQYLFPDAQNVLNLSEFHIMGTARQMLDLLVQNANRIGAGWSLGSIDTTETKQLHFSSENCLAVLSKIAQEFKLEYWVDANKSIHLTERKAVSGYSFEYGKSKGLVSLTRETQQGSNIITRLYAFGSEKNIAGNYRNGQKNLRMPVPYLEKNTDIYGIIEGSQTFDVYPHRIGKVTAINPNNPLQFTDNQLDFDLNEKDFNGTKYLINGVPLKVTFNTGQLAGYTFEVKEFGYHSATKTFTLLKNTDEKAIEIPSENLRPAVGDSYVLTDLIMPQKYIANAEAELQRKAQAYLNENSRERVVYRLATDPLYFKEQNVNLQLGSTIFVKDTDFNLEENLRIIRLVKDLQNPYKVQVEVAERAEIAHIVREYLQEEKAKTALLQADKFNAEIAKKAYRFGREIHENIFDGEGYFNTEKIKPLSIDTKHISVGSRMQQFALPDVMISVENATTIKNTRGKIVHLSLEENPREWHIPANTQMGISAGFHYIYIKAQKYGTNASVLVSSEKIAVESDPNFYHFEAGYLGSVENGNRRIRLSHGFTQISPHEITTGRISSQDGSQYIDLLQDKIKIVADVEISAENKKEILEGIQIGGRNLLLKSNEIHSNSNYNLCHYVITEDIQVGEEITLSYEGELAPNGILVLFNGSGDGNRGYIMIYPNEKQKTIKWTNNNDEKITKGTAMYVYIQNVPRVRAVNNYASTIKKIKLEKGNKATDWTPAPEDVTEQITTSETNAKTHATQEVNNLQIGGRNLLRNSQYVNGDDEGGGIKYVGEITEMKQGETYIISSEILQGNEMDEYYLNTHKDWWNGTPQNASKGVPFVASENHKHLWVWINFTTGKAEHKNIKLEKGNKATDWAPAPEDIDAQILPLKEKTDFFNNTKIKGNFITSQTLEMGNEQGAEAGITGEGLESDAVRFWAGASFENRGKAPFRVLDNGTLHAENAHIKGRIEATSGKIGGFIINSSADTKITANGLQLESGGLIRSRGSGDNSHSTAFIVNEKNTLNDVLSHSPCLSIHTSAFDQKSHSAASFSSIGANNTALRLRATKTTGTARALHIEEGIITGRQAIFETSYIGQAYWGAIEEHLHLTNTFIFTSAPNHHQSVVLPSESKIRQIVGHSNVSFELRIIVAYNCHQLIRIQGQNGGSLVNNDGNWANGQNGYLELGRGDTLTLCYHDSHYYIMSHRQ